MTTPVWQAPTAGQQVRADHVNQFLGFHKSTNLYTAVQTAAVITNGTAHSNSNSLYMAQSFTTGASQTAIGYLNLPYGSYVSSGSVLGTTSIGIWTNVAGAPGVPLVTTTITTEYAQGITQGVDTTYAPYPVPVTGLTPSTTYWIVTTPAGDPTNHYTWRQSASASGASTSTNGTTWTPQAFGFQYQVFDQTPSGNRVHTWEDSGARWTWTRYNNNGTVARTGEYTVGQNATGYLQSMRQFNYTASQLTGVV